MFCVFFRTMALALHLYRWARTTRPMHDWGLLWVVLILRSISNVIGKALQPSGGERYTMYAWEGFDDGAKSRWTPWKRRLLKIVERLHTTSTKVAVDSDERFAFRFCLHIRYVEGMRRRKLRGGKQDIAGAKEEDPRTKDWIVDLNAASRALALRWLRAARQGLDGEIPRKLSWMSSSACVSHMFLKCIPPGDVQ